MSADQSVQLAGSRDIPNGPSNKPLVEDCSSSCCSESTAAPGADLAWSPEGVWSRPTSPTALGLLKATVAAKGRTEDSGASASSDGATTAPATADSSPEPERMPSIGSSLHGSGACRPCAWFWKAQGCQNGQECRHCHLCPDGEIKARKRAKLAALLQLGSETMETFSACSTGLSPTASNQTPLYVQQIKMLDDDDDDDEESIDLRVESLLKQHSLSQARPADPEDGPIQVALPTPSLGSANHGAGLCRPCAWFWKPQGCQNGASCARCHLCPEGEIKTRKRMKLASMRAEGIGSSTGTSLKLDFCEPSNSELTLDDDDLDEYSSTVLTLTAPRHAPTLPPLEPPPVAPPGLLHGLPPLPPCGPLTTTPLEPSQGASSTTVLPKILGSRGAVGVLSDLKLRRKVKELFRSEDLEVQELELGSGAPWPGLARADLKAQMQLPQPPLLPPPGLQGLGASLLTLPPVPPPPAPPQLPPTITGPATEVRAFSKAKLAGIRLESIDGIAAFAPGSATTSSVSSPRDTVPLKATDSFTKPVSMGSLLHASGACSPCAWFWKPQGCQNGANCCRCHLCPPGEVKSRKKAKAAALRTPNLKESLVPLMPRTIRLNPLL